MDELFYWKGFMAPWLKCVDEAKGKDALQEKHGGSAGTYKGARVLTKYT